MKIIFLFFILLLPFEICFAQLRADGCRKNCDEHPPGWQSSDPALMSKDPMVHCGPHYRSAAGEVLVNKLDGFTEVDRSTLNERCLCAGKKFVMKSGKWSCTGKSNEDEIEELKARIDQQDAELKKMKDGAVK